MTDIGTDFIKTLLAGADPEKLAAFLKEIKPNTPSKPKTPKDPLHSNGPVKVYTKVTKHYTCIACGHEFDVSYNMEKGEQTSIINEKGDITSLVISGSQPTITLLCKCSICTFCKTAAAEWSREELEARWLALVQATTFKEKCQYNYNMQTGHEGGRL